MKKKSITGFAILLCVVGFIVTGCGSDDEKKAPENAVHVEEVVEDAAPEETEEIAEEPVVEEDTEDDDYVKAGDMLTFENGTVVIEDTGIYSQDDWAILYVVIDAENTSDDTLKLSQYDTSLYVDDYQIPTMFDDSATMDDVAMSEAIVKGVEIDSVKLNMSAVDINPGRRAKYILFNPVVDSMEAGENVEFEIFPGRSVLFKENGVWNYGDGIGNATIDDNPDKYIPEGIDGYEGIVYGTYSCSPNTIGGENIAYVDFATDGDGGEFVDFIMIDSYEADDEGMPNNFGGDIVKNGNSYSVTGASGGMLSISFVDGGMNVEVLYGDNMEEFAGYYKLDEELDLNSVG